MSENPEFILHNGVKYIRADIPEMVYKRIYDLLKDQKRYFATRDNALKVSCKQREDGFLRWYEGRNQMAMQL